MDPDGNLPAQIILLLILIGINAFFAMSELAIVSLNDARLRKMATEGHKKAGMIVKLIGKPSQFLATIQVGVTLSGFFASAVAADSFAGYLVAALPVLPVSPGVLRTICLAVITLLLSFFTLVFGELVPKRIAMHHYEAIAMRVVGPLTALSKIEKPLVALLSSTTNGILRLIGINPDAVPEQVTEEEIRMMVDVGGESGNIAESDREMINNIFEFDDTTAEEIMTHRTEVVAVEHGADLDEIITTATESGHSRIPVYENDLDSIVGILYVKDLLGLITKQLDFNLKDYMREPMYVPESISCQALFAEFKIKRIQMAVVVDEYGGTAGVVTMEDLLESIVGNIQDEYDDEDEDILKMNENTYQIDGLADLEDICKALGITLPDEEREEFETIGGLIVYRLGYIPAEHDKPSVRVGDILFTVLEMEDRRIAKLRAERVAETMPEEARVAGAKDE